MDQIFQDFKYGLRSLKSGTGLIVVAIVSLALGIGANTTIFSAVDAFMLRPLPYPQSEQLYSIYTTNQEHGWTQASFSVPDFVDLRRESEILTVAAYTGRGLNLSGGDRPERLSAQAVSGNFFQLIRTPPALGRGFSVEEEQPGNGNVVIISDGLWRRRFAADSNILGSEVRLNSEPYTVVGVMPEGFWFNSTTTDVWIPFTVTGRESRSSHFVQLTARIEDGFSAEQGKDEAQRIVQQLAQTYPETNTGNGVNMIGLHADVFGEGFRTGSLIASFAVVFVLLIACANVANLLLTRAAGRYREVALRGALGASRTRIIRQLLTEALIISSFGGVLGVLLSLFGIKALVSVMPTWFPNVNEIGLDMKALAFTGGITLLTGIIFGLAPALQSSKPDMVDALKEGGRGGTSGRGSRLRQILVVAEVALALVLLVSSALLVKGFILTRHVDRGFDPSDVLTFVVSLPEREYPDSASVNIFNLQFEDRLLAIPGVRSVGATNVLPLQGNSGTYYSLPGEVIETDADRKITNYRSVLPGYFEAMDIAVQSGRPFEESDDAKAPRVILVNETLAERHWDAGNPVGEQIAFYSGPRRIIGVVSDEKVFGSDPRPRPMVYFPALQGQNRGLGWVVETSVPPQQVADGARAALASLDSNLPIFNVQSMDELVETQIADDSIMAKIMIVLSVIALVLSLGGVYGVMAYTVSQRTQEMGIRLALGARRSTVLRMIVKQGAVLAVLGVVIGTGMALGVTRTLSIFLLGVNPFDPVIFVGVGAALLAAGITATVFPARRATKVDPIVALRTE